MFKYLPRKPSLADRVKNRNKRTARSHKVLDLKRSVARLFAQVGGDDAAGGTAEAWKALAR